MQLDVPIDVECGRRILEWINENRKKRALQRYEYSIARNMRQFSTKFYDFRKKKSHPSSLL